MTATLANVSCVAIGGRGVLIEGAPGSGKSSLALALIDRGAALVGDDGVTPRLTAREVEVLSNLRDGLTQRQVGSRLRVAEETVRAHLKSVRAKYMEAERDVTNSGSLVREADRDGWI